MRPSSLPCTVLLTLVACGPSSSVDEGLGEVGGLDTSEAGITAFVREGRYREWLAEPAPRRSVRSHGDRVRVFFNDVLARSMAEGNRVHPVGSITVKELFESDGRTTRGHALDIKVAEGTGKDTWVFYEGFGPNYDDNYYGRGHDTCHGCHADQGTDYVATPLPR
ncbi:hypothetical protein OWM54_20980 [Myxococcus sp. MISCRS1]|uniref:hypothetical protein n=1 Tax=Myxococcus sp. MISCRS1 TaxID=2996786 RepID=UPI0022713D04|nr:hypothetical protein [Myxococcus sp. MISCRS1]MCY0999612.1 hypothetical protein [Myxococcus sp. MISCRS1]